MQCKTLLSALLLTVFTATAAIAQDITGTWKSIDDKTGSSKAILTIHQEKNGTYTGKVVKITPRPGYTPRETCIDCPAPYTNKPILGLEVLKDLKKLNSEEYANGRILDPLTGKTYSKKQNSVVMVNVYNFAVMSVCLHLGRSQTWIREN